MYYTKKSRVFLILSILFSNETFHRIVEFITTLLYGCLPEFYEGKSQLTVNFHVKVLEKMPRQVV